MENQRRIELDKRLKYDGIWLNYELEWRKSNDYMMKYDDLVIEIAKLKGTKDEFDDYAYDEQRQSDIEQAATIVQENQIAEENRRLDDEEYQLEQEALEAEDVIKDTETLIAEELLRNKEEELDDLCEKYNEIFEALESLDSGLDIKSLLESQNVNHLHAVFIQDREEFGKSTSAIMLVNYLLSQRAQKEDK